jgi:transposase
MRRKLTIPERWQAVGMHNGGFSHRRVADHFRVNHSINVRLMQRVRQTGNVTDRPRAGRPRKTTPREDRLISRRARQRPFSTAGALRGNLAFGGHISTRTIIRRLHHQGMRAWRPIKRPQLTLRHRHARFDWSHDHLGWTIRTWRVCQWLATGRWFSPGPPVSFTNKTERHGITEILLKVALNTIKPNQSTLADLNLNPFVVIPAG